MNFELYPTNMYATEQWRTVADILPFCVVQGGTHTTALQDIKRGNNNVDPYGPDPYMETHKTKSDV